MVIIMCPWYICYNMYRPRGLFLHNYLIVHGGFNDSLWNQWPEHTLDSCGSQM